MKRILQLSFFVLFLNATQSHAQLVANFVADTTKGCAPLDSVQFTDLSTGTPTTWLWNFGNGNTSILPNPQASYPNPGVYTVTLTVGNGTTTSQMIKTAYITVFQLPVAGFTYTPAQPCVGSVITFYDNTAPGNASIVSWDWGFGDGTTSSVLVDSVTHTYSSPFTPAPVSVIVIDSNGCKDDFLANITVNPAPAANFTATPLTGCVVPFNVTFTNTSTATIGSTYLWNFGDGLTSTSTNPVHSYTTPGSYTVTLILTQGGCKDTIIIANYILIAPYVVDFVASDVNVCVGEPVTFTETTGSPSAGQTWDFGDGGTSFILSPVHTYTAANVYTVTLVAANQSGCGDTAKKINYITVHAQPVASFVANDTVGCSVPFTVNFSTPAGNTGWSWSFGDGGTSLLQNPSHIYTAPGSYTVTLIITNSNGCKDTLVKPGYVNIIPPNAQFNFIPKKGCAPLTVNFTSTSTAIEPFFNYTWNYGDGSPNAVTTVGTTTHTYANPGVYTVSLIVNTINGCKDTLIKVDSVLVGTHVTPSFTISDDTVCYHQPIQFTFNTPGANSWVWIFGDGGIDSTQMNPVHIYGDTGTFTVSLVACNNGCCDTLVIPDMITILPPKAQFSLTGSCVLPYNIICTNNSKGADSIVWNFHDGTPLVSNISPLTHTFASRGPKTITIYAYNFASGCVDSMTLNYTVVDPIANFSGTPLSGCYPLTVTFTDISQDAYTRNMFFGDGLSLYTPLTTFPHTYALPGYYDVKMVIYDIHGCTDTLTKPDYIHVYGPLTAFTVNKDTGCAPLSVIFTDTTVSQYAIVSRIWNFGDGIIDTIVSPNFISHTYTNPGSYTVTLTVFDSQGCSHTLTIPNYINPTLPMAAFSVDTFSCPNKVITFNAAASTGLNLSYHWLFGDGGSAVTTSNTTTHTYAANGNYTVTLTVFDQNLCDSTVTHSIHIEKPNASFTDSIAYDCQYTKVYFTNTSTGTNITSYYWNFGDGGYSTVPSPYNQYTLPGYFTPYLVVTNSAGCKDTVRQDSLVVVYKPSGTFSFDPKEGCKPLVVTFTANASGIVTGYSWDFGDGTPTETGQTVTHIYEYDITATPQLILYSNLPDGTTCTLKANVTGDSLIVVNTFGSAAIAVNGDTSQTSVIVSEGDETPLSAIIDLGGSGTPSYVWTPSTGLTFNSDSSIVTLSGTGTSDYYLKLTVEGQGGCTGLDSILVKVVPCDSHMEVPNVFTPNGDMTNDEFFVEHPCPENFLLTIYNRWGQEVFKTSDPVEKWDGRIGNGDFVPSGTYYWILASRDKAMKGFLQLFREEKK